MAEFAAFEAQLEKEAALEEKALLDAAIAGFGGDIDEETLALLQATAAAESERKK